MCQYTYQIAFQCFAPDKSYKESIHDMCCKTRSCFFFVIICNRLRVKCFIFQFSTYIELVIIFVPQTVFNIFFGIFAKVDHLQLCGMIAYFFRDSVEEGCSRERERRRKNAMSLKSVMNIYLVETKAYKTWNAKRKKDERKGRYRRTREKRGGRKN